MDVWLIAGWAATLLAGAASGWFTYKVKERSRADKQLTEHDVNLKNLEERFDKHESGCEDRTQTLHDRISAVRRELGEDISRLGGTMGKLMEGQGRIMGRLEAIGKRETG